MKTIRPVKNQILSWQDVKEWLESMNEDQLAQAAFVCRDGFLRKDGWLYVEEMLIGTTSKDSTGMPLPRLIGETFPAYRKGQPELCKKIK